jgi:hypothetical protein
VSADEKVNILEELSTGPAERGGVAVIVLGYTKAICCGETGCAVNGVSGYVGTKGVMILGFERSLSTGDWRLKF